MTCPLCDRKVPEGMMSTHLVGSHQAIFQARQRPLDFDVCTCGKAFIGFSTHLYDEGCLTEADVVQHIFDGIMGRREP